VSSSMELDVYIGVSNLGSQNIEVQWALLSTPWQTAFTTTSSSVVQRKVTISGSALTAQIIYVRVINSDTSSNRNPLTTVRVDYVAVNAFVSSITAAVDCFQGSVVSSDCSTFCGTGEQTLTRPTLQAPMNGGAPCDVATWTVPCNDFTRCPVNCVLSGWSAYSACNANCGDGTKTRTRTVQSHPVNGGAPCGPLSESAPCSAVACSGINCIWGPWTPSGSCSKDCGTGEQTFTRTIAWPKSDGGADCTGASSKVEPCNTQACVGAMFNVRLQSLLKTDTDGVYFQVWTSSAATISDDVSLVLTGQATDKDTLSLADGWWQLSLTSMSPACKVTTLDLECPGASTPSTSNIGGIVGKLQCTSSVGEISAYANATFEIEC